MVPSSLHPQHNHRINRGEDISHPRRVLSLKQWSRLESIMTNPSESTKLEGLGGFFEYVGSGKLKGKKALITGGEYV